jgi:hypothetical protein
VPPTVSTPRLAELVRRGPVYWTAYYHRGKEHRESTRSDSETQARKLLKKRLGEIGRGRLIGPQEEKVTFEDLAADILRDYQVAAVAHPM